MEVVAKTGASALARKLDAIRDGAGVQGREIAQLLGTTPQTVSRWRTGKAEPQRRSLDRLLTLAWLTEELAEFYRPDEARLWLFSPIGCSKANAQPTASRRAASMMFWR